MATLHQINKARNIFMKTRETPLSQRWTKQELCEHVAAQKRITAEHVAASIYALPRHHSDVHKLSEKFLPYIHVKKDVNSMLEFLLDTGYINIRYRIY